jgi:hypothetical protein
MCGFVPDAPETSEAPDGATVISGSVVRDDAPVAGAYVRLLDSSGEFTAEVVTSATGGFRFFARPGSWKVRALAPGATGEASVDAVEGSAVTTRIALSAA